MEINFSSLEMWRQLIRTIFDSFPIILELLANLDISPAVHKELQITWKLTSVLDWSIENISVILKPFENFDTSPGT